MGQFPNRTTPTAYLVPPWLPMAPHSGCTLSLPEESHCDRVLVRVEGANGEDLCRAIICPVPDCTAFVGENIAGSWGRGGWWTLREGWIEVGVGRLPVSQLILQVGNLCPDLTAPLHVILTDGVLRPAKGAKKGAENRVQLTADSRGHFMFPAMWCYAGNPSAQGLQHEFSITSEGLVPAKLLLTVNPGRHPSRLRYVCRCWRTWHTP